MAIYRVTRWHTPSLTKISEHYRSTRPGAFHAARSVAYQCLMAFGKLDTEAAHKVMREIEASDDLLPIGEQRAFTISNTENSVVVSRVE